MERRAHRIEGFSLIEVAVAVAVIAIFAGALLPLALKTVNHSREQRTRDELKIAYEALFGAADRRVSNMRADFGYAGGSLAQMTTRGSFRVYGTYPTQPALMGGWTAPIGLGCRLRQGFHRIRGGDPTSSGILAAGTSC